MVGRGIPQESLQRRLRDWYFVRSTQNDSLKPSEQGGLGMMARRHDGGDDS
jgi:hypothetical protein